MRHPADLLERWTGGVSERERINDAKRNPLDYIRVRITMQSEPGEPFHCEVKVHRETLQRQEDLAQLVYDMVMNPHTQRMP